jgi:hypothetical protein
VVDNSGVQPGWYADPHQRFELRYFNGAAWTADVSNRGERFVDPLGIDPLGIDPLGIDLHDSDPHDSDLLGSDVGSGTNAPATAAMVLGIIAVTIAWLPFIVVFGVIAAVLALVFGTLGVRRAGPSGAGKSRAIVGLITGASGLGAAVLGVALTVVVFSVYNDYLDPAPNETAITSCETVGSRATATGTLTNLGGDTTDFSVLIGFVRTGTDNPHRTSRVLLDDVEPGRPVEFEAGRQVELDEVDCIVIEVTGALPFGLALD